MLLLRRQEGFTLNEVLISIVLIAIGVLGFSLNTIGVIQGNYISANYTIATNLAQDKLEGLKAQITFSDVTDSPDPNNPISATGEGGGTFTRTWTIRDSSLGTELKEITVTVSWTDYVGREVKISTLVFTDTG